LLGVGKANRSIITVKCSNGFLTSIVISRKGGMPQKPEFSQRPKDILAQRASQWCSNPDCLNETSGPHSDATRAVNLGEAAHIRGANPDSPRYDRAMTDEQRRHISNGIWLCTGCAKEIDKDEKRFPVKLLLIWKATHEQWVQHGGIKTLPDYRVREELSRLQKENTDLRRENEALNQKLKSKEDFQNQYLLMQTPGGAWVYISRENRNHYACPSCWDNKGNKEILCERNAHYGLFECPGCKNSFRVNPSQHIPQSHARRPGNPFSRTNL
jgi:hypothetical protein